MTSTSRNFTKWNPVNWGHCIRELSEKPPRQCTELQGASSSFFFCWGPRRKAVIPNPGAGILCRRLLMELCVQQWSRFPIPSNQVSLLSAFLEGVLCLPTKPGSWGDQSHLAKVSFYQYPSPAQYWPSEMPRSSGKYLTTGNLGRVTWRGEVSFPKRCQKKPDEQFNGWEFRAGKSVEVHQPQRSHPTSGPVVSPLLCWKSNHLLGRPCCHLTWEQWYSLLFKKTKTAVGEPGGLLITVSSWPLLLHLPNFQGEPSRAFWRWKSPFGTSFMAVSIFWDDTFRHSCKQKTGVPLRNQDDSCFLVSHTQMFRGRNTTEDKTRKPIFLKSFSKASIKAKCVQVSSVNILEPSKVSFQAVHEMNLLGRQRDDFCSVLMGVTLVTCKGFSQALLGCASGCPHHISEEVGAPFRHLSQPCLLKLAINYFPLMAKKKEARRKDMKSVAQEEQVWCENQVAYVWRLYLVSGDPGEYQA